MKRSLILSLCAVVLAAIGISAAQAVTDAALNLRYTDPADPTEGGTWTLVVRSDDPNSNGVVGLVSRFTNIDPNSIAIDGGIGHDIGVSGGLFGSAIEIVYGQDPNDGLVSGVGQGGGPVDPLNNVLWDGATVVATGTFGGSRPDVDPNSSPGSNIDDIIAGIIASTTTSRIRGDSLVTLGLEAGGAGLQVGDANRDGTTDVADLSTMSPLFNTSPGDIATAWNSGDYNDDGSIDVADLSAMSPVFNTSSIPPAIGAVPEPATVALLAVGLSGLAFRRRRLH